MVGAHPISVLELIKPKVDRGGGGTLAHPDLVQQAREQLVKVEPERDWDGRKRRQEYGSRVYAAPNPVVAANVRKVFAVVPILKTN